MSVADTRDRAEEPVRFPRYAVTILFLVYALSFLDRQIINILAEPIKRDLHLSDWQLGATTGLSFALLYTTLAIPIASLADRMHRGRIIAVALIVWSAFTATCGLATSFWHLLLSRLGVGLGEAGFSPAAQSLITDLTTRQNRARALSFYAMGVPCGSLLGMVIGGVAVDIWGWREAFLFVGLPGVVVGIVAMFTLRDPRHQTAGAAVAATAVPKPSIARTFREIRAKPSFWWLSFGAALTSFVGYGHQSFFASFYLRNHSAELNAYAADFGLGVTGLLGIALGLLLGIGGSIGTLLGGFAADRYIGRGPQVYAIVPAIGTLLAGPLYMVAFLLPSGVAALFLLLVPTILKNMWFGPVFAGIQGVVDQRSRAITTAIFLFILNMFGLGLGPICIGLLSDVLGRYLGEAEGLRWAMISLSGVGLLSGYCFWRARLALLRDQVSDAG